MTNLVIAIFTTVIIYILVFVLRELIFSRIIFSLYILLEISIFDRIGIIILPSYSHLLVNVKFLPLLISNESSMMTCVQRFYLCNQKIKNVTSNDWHLPKVGFTLLLLVIRSLRNIIVVVSYHNKSLKC